jgi:hypothetical protein
MAFTTINAKQEIYISPKQSYIKIRHIHGITAIRILLISTIQNDRDGTFGVKSDSSANGHVHGDIAEVTTRSENSTRGVDGMGTREFAMNEKREGN